MFINLFSLGSGNLRVFNENNNELIINLFDGTKFIHETARKPGDIAILCEMPLTLSLFDFGTATNEYAHDIVLPNRFVPNGSYLYSLAFSTLLRMILELLSTWNEFWTSFRWITQKICFVFCSILYSITSNYTNINFLLIINGTNGPLSEQKKMYYHCPNRNLKQILWSYSRTYKEIFEGYRQFVFTLYGTNSSIVFDKYNKALIGTKLYERYRRKEKVIASDVAVAEDHLVTLK